MLRLNQNKLGVECYDTDDFSGCFADLIKLTYEKYNQKVVVLIDEYDKAILDNLDQMEVARENREIIKALYTILKGSEEYIKFSFLTGVSKFSKASIFSGLNMLRDISLDKKYGNICGYTQDDIDSKFIPYLQGVDLDKLRVWYNGYNFLKDSVYNPFDILLFIENNFIYKNYWFETGTPTFLIKLIDKNSYFLPKLSNISVDDKLLDSFDIDNIDLEVILYQAGYLTIDKMEIDEDLDIIYTLKIPNREVKVSFNQSIIYSLYRDKSQNRKDISKSLRESDLASFKTAFNSIFASIPYNNYANNSINIYEGYYASVVYVYLQSLGIDIVGEDVTNRGRIDLTLKLDNYIYIIEFKVGSENALQQIKDRDYAKKYLDDKREIYLVGINFDRDKKEIINFEWERV